MKRFLVAIAGLVAAATVSSQPAKAQVIGWYHGVNGRFVCTDIVVGSCVALGFPVGGQAPTEEWVYYPGDKSPKPMWEYFALPQVNAFGVNVTNACAYPGPIPATGLNPIWPPVGGTCTQFTSGVAAAPNGLVGTTILGLAMPFDAFYLRVIETYVNAGGAPIATLRHDATVYYHGKA